MTNKEILVGVFTFLLAFTTFTRMVYAQESGGFEYELADIPTYWVIESEAFSGYGAQLWADWKDVFSIGDFDGDEDREGSFDTRANVEYMGKLILTSKDSFSGSDIWSVVVKYRAYMNYSHDDSVETVSLRLYDVTEGKDVILKGYKISKGAAGWKEDEFAAPVKPNHEYKLRLVLHDDWGGQIVVVSIEHVSATPSTERVAEEEGIPWLLIAPPIAIIATAILILVYRRRR